MDPSSCHLGPEADRPGDRIRHQGCRSCGRSFVHLEEGERYSPRKIADTRKSVGRIEALGSVRMREAEALDANGNVPVFVEVTERKPRLFGMSARYSTVDGPGIHAYWAHRNLFGGAERLRLDADIGFFANKTAIIKWGYRVRRHWPPCRQLREAGVGVAQRPPSRYRS
jgi:hypothetical protein